MDEWLGDRKMGKQSGEMRSREESAGGREVSWGGQGGKAGRTQRELGNRAAVGGVWVRGEVDLGMERRQGCSVNRL